MIFKVSVIFAFATLAVVANAEGERFCNGAVDPADCNDLAGLCGNTLISGKFRFPEVSAGGVKSIVQSWSQTCPLTRARWLVLVVTTHVSEVALMCVPSPHLSALVTADGSKATTATSKNVYVSLACGRGLEP